MHFRTQMAKEMPKANDEAFGIQDAERNTYWCHFAMVHKNHQGKGIVKALFNLATTEVCRLTSFTPRMQCACGTRQLTHDSKAAKRNAKIALTTTSARNVSATVVYFLRRYPYPIVNSGPDLREARVHTPRT